MARRKRRMSKSCKMVGRGKMKRCMCNGKFAKTYRCKR